MIFQDFYGNENASAFQLNSQPCKKRALGGETGTLSGAPVGKAARANTNSTGILFFSLSCSCDLVLCPALQIKIN